MSSVLITASIGYYLGGKGISSWPTLIFLMMGTALVCGGAAVLNNTLEWEADKKMLRTRNRAIPAGKISPVNALTFGIILVLLGIFVLYFFVNLLTAFLGLLTAFLYVLVYTPLKRLSWFNTSIGAIPGALPPVGGWAAATGQIDLGAGALFLILFIWQHPHFYAIAWMFREDYKRGGFKMLPVIEPDGKKTFAQILIFSLVLIPVSIFPTMLGVSGLIYCAGVIIAGIFVLKISVKLCRTHTIGDAKNLLKATVLYLPILLALIVLDVTF